MRAHSKIGVLIPVGALLSLIAIFALPWFDFFIGKITYFGFIKHVSDLRQIFDIGISTSGAVTRFWLLVLVPIAVLAQFAILVSASRNGRRGLGVSIATFSIAGIALAVYPISTYHDVDTFKILDVGFYATLVGFGASLIGAVAVLLESNTEKTDACAKMTIREITHVAREPVRESPVSDWDKRNIDELAVRFFQRPDDVREQLRSGELYELFRAMEHDE